MTLFYKILLIAGVLLIGLAYFKGRSDGSTTIVPDNSKEKKATEHQIDSLNERITGLEADTARLYTLNRKLNDDIQQINPNENIPQLDAQIKKDSTASVHLFRLQLSTLGYDTSKSKILTYYEIGTGAKELSTIPGLKLKLDSYSKLRGNYEDILQIKDRMIETLKDKNNAQLHLNELSNANLEKYKSAYEDTKSIFYNFPLRAFLLIGGFVIGLLSAGIIK